MQITGPDPEVHLWYGDSLYLRTVNNSSTNPTAGLSDDIFVIRGYLRSRHEV